MSSAFLRGERKQHYVKKKLRTTEKSPNLASLKLTDSRN
jgi:hypothetical protein